MSQPNYKELCQIFALNARTLRLRMGLSQRAAARRLKTSQAYCCHVEQGKRKPTIAMLSRMCRVYNAPPAAFFSIPDSQAANPGVRSEHERRG